MNILISLIKSNFSLIFLIYGYISKTLYNCYSSYKTKGVKPGSISNETKNGLVNSIFLSYSNCILSITKYGDLITLKINTNGSYYDF